MKRLYSSNEELNTLEEKTLKKLQRVFILAEKSLSIELKQLLEEISLFPDDSYQIKLLKVKTLLNTLTKNLKILNGKPLLNDLIQKSFNIGTLHAVDTIFDLSRQPVVKAFVPTEAIVSFIKNANVNLYKYDAEIKSRIVDKISIGMARGDSYSKVKQDLVSNLQIVAYKAERIIRTESISAFNDANMYQYRDSGIEQTQWTAGLEASGRVCPICSDLHGQIFNIDDTPLCPAHPNCRCVVLPYSDKWNVNLNQYKEDRENLLELFT